MPMIRTSLLLPPAMHQQLLMTSRQESKSLSDLARELFSTALHHRQKDHTRRIYEGLEQLHGIGRTQVTDASTTIDELLYGENGVWKGIRDK